MKFILSFLLICFLALAFGEDGCTFKGKSLKVGEEYSSSGKCVKYICKGKGSVNAIGCLQSVAPSNCKRIPQDDSKTYPECCERFEC